MFWTGTEDSGGYGMMNKHGDPWPVFHAKKLCAQHIRHGDWISFPTSDDNSVDVVAARGDDGREQRPVRPPGGQAGHLRGRLARGRRTNYRRLLKIDQGTGNGIAESPLDGTVRLEGYGVAAVTTAAADPDHA